MSLTNKKPQEITRLDPTFLKQLFDELHQKNTIILKNDK